MYEECEQAWVDSFGAMNFLGLKTRSHLYTLRSQGKISSRKVEKPVAHRKWGMVRMMQHEFSVASLQAYRDQRRQRNGIGLCRSPMNEKAGPVWKRRIGATVDDDTYTQILGITRANNMTLATFLRMAVESIVDAYDDQKGGGA